MTDKVNIFKSVFGVVARGQSYLNILYLLLAFPLGLVYFTFLITGFSLSVGLWVIWVGIFLMALMIVAWWGLAIFERKMAIWMLRVDIPPMHRPDIPRAKFLEKVKEHFQNPVTWKSLAYLLIKFPLGILTFNVAVTLIAITVSLVAAPFIYTSSNIHLGFTDVDTLWKALLCSGAGLLIGVASLHVMNGLAFVSAWLARVMLGTPVHNPKGNKEIDVQMSDPQVQPEVL
jgi:hypothetical protein